MRNCLSFILLTLFCYLSAQDPHHIIFDANDGLPSSEVYDIETDNNNNLWFSTDRGVSRYNGYNFENFTTDDGLTDNTIFEICKDRNGWLWFCCYDGSVCYYDYESIKPAPFNKALHKRIMRNWVRQIYFDDDNNLLFFTARYMETDTFSGHYKYDRKSDSLSIAYPTENDSFLLFGSNTNSFIYSRELGHYSHLFAPINDQDFVYGYPRKTKLIMTEGKYGAIDPVDKNTSSIYLSSGGNNKLVYEKALNIIELHYDRFGTLWAMSNQGLKRFSENLSGNPESILSSFDCSSMLLDSENNYWVATNNKGVVLIPAITIEQYPSELFGKHKLLDLQTLDSHLLIGDYKGGIYSLDKNKDIKKLLQYGDQLLNMEKSDKGIYLFNNSLITERSGKIVLDVNAFSESNFTKVFMKPDEEHFLKNFNELRWYDINSENRLQARESLFTPSRVTTLAKDENDRIWLGTLDGIYWIDDYRSSPEKFQRVFSDKYIGRVSTFQQSVHPVMYIGTLGQGLFIYDDTDAQLVHIELNYDTEISIIHCLFEENDSTLWIGTNVGLFEAAIDFQTDNYNIKIKNHLNTRSGLSSDFVYDIKKWNDKIWLVNENSLNAFRPGDIKSDISPPVVYFDSIVNNSNKIDIGTRGDFSFAERNLRFYFSSNSFKKNTRTAFYKYALVQTKGDTSWQYTNSRYIQYTNLSPGSYRFIVKARNGPDNWSTMAAEYEFRVGKHIAQTSSFRLFLLLLVMSLSYLIYWFVSRQQIQKEKQKLKLQEVEMRAQKAELDALRGQMNPHFVYNALNSIQNYIFKGDKEKANYYLTRFSSLMRNSLDMSKLELVSINEECAFLKNYLELEKMRFDNKFDYSIDLDPNLEQNSKIPPLLIQPLVENSIKHGFKNIAYKGHVKISLKHAVDHLLIQIADNGRGLEIKQRAHQEQKKYKSLSTQIIRERLNLINMTNSGKKAELIIKSLDKNNKFSFETGTIAEIILPLTHAPT